MLYPLIRAGQFSLYEWPGFGPATFVGLGNYTDLLSDERFHASIIHALVLILFYSILPLMLGLVLAAVLRRGLGRAARMGNQARPDTAASAGRMRCMWRVDCRRA